VRALRRDFDVEWNTRDQDTWDMIWFFEQSKKGRKRKKRG
jgi:hypothetical protein